MVRAAVVQRAPVFGDRAATLEVAVAALAEAAAAGAQLVVLPEHFVPGYPAWIWRLRPGTDARQFERLYALWRDNAVDLDDPASLALLTQAARLHGVTVVCGLAEIDSRFSRGTLYNTVVVIGPDGALVNRHRKLMPTNPERMLWGHGDASGLRVVDTPSGRIGALICWENYMPLARAALYAQGVEILVAPTYDAGPVWLATMQHIAREGGCWVLGNGSAFRGSDMPNDSGAAGLYNEEGAGWVNDGDSVIVAPGGKIVAGPLHQAFGLLYAEIDLARVGLARRSLDVAGHYARSDIFQLHVDSRVMPPAQFTHDDSSMQGETP